MVGRDVAATMSPGAPGRGPGSDRVALNVGGVAYLTTRATLTAVRGSFLCALAEHSPLAPGGTGGQWGGGKAGQDGPGEHFIDRDGGRFRHILNYLRNLTVPALWTEDLVLLHELIEEADFYGLPQLRDALEARALAVQEERAAREDERQEHAEAVARAVGKAVVDSLGLRKRQAAPRVFRTDVEF